MAFRTRESGPGKRRLLRGRIGLASVGLAWLVGIGAWLALPTASHSLTGPARQATPTAAADDNPVIPEKFARFAANALLVPLLDDTLPLRWSDAGLDLYCGPGTVVLVDGEPLQAGAPLPARSFTLLWHMDLCRPLGIDSLELSGEVELNVYYEEDGLGATVVPQGLRVRTPEGFASPREAFTAFASVGP